jgi:hypothetical protein
MAAPSPFPEWLPLDTAGWEQTALTVRHLVLQLLDMIQQQQTQIRQQEARIKALEARLQQKLPQF